MSEPSVEEIVAKADQCGNLHGRELSRLIASWRERGEALKAVEPVHDKRGYLTLDVGRSIAAWVEKRDAALAVAGHTKDERSLVQPIRVEGLGESGK